MAHVLCINVCASVWFGGMTTKANIPYLEFASSNNINIVWRLFVFSCKGIVVAIVVVNSLQPTANEWIIILQANNLNKDTHMFTVYNLLRSMFGRLACMFDGYFLCITHLYTFAIFKPILIMDNAFGKVFGQRFWASVILLHRKLKCDKWLLRIQWL